MRRKKRYNKFFEEIDKQQAEEYGTLELNFLQLEILDQNTNYNEEFDPGSG